MIIFIVWEVVNLAKGNLTKQFRTGNILPVVFCVLRRAGESNPHADRHATVLETVFKANSGALRDTISSAYPLSNIQYMPLAVNYQGRL